MSADDTPAVSRRDFILIAGGTTAASAAAGEAVAQDGNETETGNSTETGNQTGGNQSGGNETGGNESGGGGNQSGGNESSGGGGATPIEETVTVGPGNELVFEPETVKVTPGSTVTWKWDSGGHNVSVNNQPDGANWEGHENIEDSGFTYENTFEKTGTYEYVCTPHEQQGMTGSVEVAESLSTPGGGGGGGPPPVPDSARTLGVASAIGLTSTLGLAYFLMRYGGDYRED